MGVTKYLIYLNEWYAVLDWQVHYFIIYKIFIQNKNLKNNIFIVNVSLDGDGCTRISNNICNINLIIRW